MGPEIHQRVRQLFDEAMEWPENERLSRLRSACSGSPDLLEAVSRLLEAHGSCDSFLENGACPIQRIGRYLIAGELGRGAMGVVYNATDPVIGRKVAVKVIRLQALADPAEAQLLRERLFREARSAGRLSHPCIVKIFDVDQEGQLAFIVMELVEGQSLDRLIASGRRCHPGEAFTILRQVAAALDYAHGHGVLHRDVKPANIIVDVNWNARIADFGIARHVSLDRYTDSGIVVGTPLYISPEQLEGLPADGRSDQFSLAIVAYELLTGGRPFQGESLAALTHTIVYAERPSAHGANPELPLAMDAVWRRGLARSPDGRYASCTEFVWTLEMALKDASISQVGVRVSSPRPSLALLAADGAENHSPRFKRNLLWAGALLACVLGFVLFQVLSPGHEQAGSLARPENGNTKAPPGKKSVLASARPVKPQRTTPQGTVGNPSPASRRPDAAGERASNEVSKPTLPVSPSSAGDAPMFHMDSLKLNTSGPSNSSKSWYEADRMTMENRSLRQLIASAYEVFDFQILGPDWASEQRFDLTASYPRDTRPEVRGFILRKILEERFKLTAHQVRTQRTGFLLVVIQERLKLKPAGDGAGSVEFRPGEVSRIIAKKTSMKQLANVLSDKLESIVTDATKVGGTYDFELTWRGSAASVKGMNFGDPAPLSAALGERLGLRLQARKEPLSLVAVDHLEKMPVPD